ncbi:hypothetical protein BC831DRAFT_461009 [Entophlyctis helioformis]|nr:hypothetical protein BC831DRAFT_461009 [Entophlyctis helioformis]
MASNAKLIFVSQGSALQCSVISVCGIVFLLGMGALYQARVDELVEGKNAPKDPIAVARACYVAAFIYAGFFFFCFCQSYLHTKKNEEERRFSGI